MPLRPRPIAAALTAALTLTACGGSSGHSSAPTRTRATTSNRTTTRTTTTAAPRDATLVLDFTPNAIHAGIYSAMARGYTRAAGVHLHVMAPPASPDSVKLLESGRADFAILDIHDLALARQDHQDVVGIMAIVEQPLAAVVASDAIRAPRDLQGRLVGVTGAPSDIAVLDSIVAGDHGDPRRVHTITIGYNAVPDLLARRVVGATAFWNDEGVTLSHRHPGFHSFRVQRFGAPAYPELVLCATSRMLRRDPALARDVVHALARGYAFAIRNPEGSEADLESAVQSLDPRLVAEQLTAERSAFIGPGHRVGVLDRRTLVRWGRWEQAFGIVRRTPDVTAMFDPRFLPRR